jgi:CRP-like cAMP-binding protein
MNTDRLFQVLSAIHPVSEPFRKAITKELTHLSLPKHHLLLEAPRVAEYAYFLDRGFAMSYICIEGERQIEGFWVSGQILVPAKSFFEQLPSTEFIQLMEQSDVFCISYAGVMRLFDAFPEANLIYRVVMNQYYESSRERIRDLQHLTAMQRYARLVSGFPHIEQVVPQEYIASYLGITPQSLSRIKRRDHN